MNALRAGREWIEAARRAVGASGRAAWLAIGLAASALILRWAADGSPELVERLYSRTLYPWIQLGLSTLSGAAPFSVGELALAAAVAWVALTVARLARAAVQPTPERPERVVRELWRLALFACWLYAAYMFGWAFNYAREPFALAARLDVRPATAEEVEGAAREWLERASALRSQLPEGPDGVVALSPDFARHVEAIARAWERAGELDPRLAGAKPALRECSVSSLMSLAGISGIYWPFTGEPHVNAQAPLAGRLFSSLHEVAHQRGFAREDEANYLACFVGWRSEDPELAYSAALIAFRYLSAPLRATQTASGLALLESVPAGVKRDQDAINRFWKPKSRTIEHVRVAASAVNDSYLKAQGQTSGVRSYGRMVDLLIAERRPRLAPPQR